MSGSPSARPERALVTIVAWPPEWTLDQRLAALAAGLGMDPTDGRRLAPCPAPLLVGACTLEQAREQSRGLRSAGVPAMISTAATLDQLGQRVRAKRLMPALGAPEPMYLVEPWDRRLESAPLRMREVRLIVRGRVRVARGGRPENGDTEPAGDNWDVITQQEAPWLGPDHDAAVGAGGVAQVAATGEIVDLYRDGQPPIRIDGRKFNFDVLGVARGLTDRINADRLALRLTEEARAAQVDVDFEHWRRGGSPFVPARGDAERAFDFYSGWKAHLEAALRAARQKMEGQAAGSDGVGRGHDAPKPGRPPSQ